MTPTGFCLCGCGMRTAGFFSPGHDKRAEAMLLRVLYGTKDTVASFLDAHGYGSAPGKKNLKAEIAGREKRAEDAWNGDAPSQLAGRKRP